MVESCREKCEVLEWKDCKKTDFKNSDGIIFSGSPTMFTEVNHKPYIKKFSFIREGKIPVLGICFGHQLMGILHDAKIFRGEEIRSDNKIRILKKDILFNGLFPETTMKEDHTEGISLPAAFIHLATSSSYTVEGMRHPVLPLWGIQFHPEVSGRNGKKLIGNFISFCKGKIS